MALALNAPSRPLFSLFDLIRTFISASLSVLTGRELRNDPIDSQRSSLTTLESSGSALARLILTSHVARSSSFPWTGR